MLENSSTKGQRKQVGDFGNEKEANWVVLLGLSRN